MPQFMLTGEDHKPGVPLRTPSSALPTAGQREKKPMGRIAALLGLCCPPMTVVPYTPSTGKVRPLDGSRVPRVLSRLWRMATPICMQEALNGLGGL